MVLSARTRVTAVLAIGLAALPLPALSQPPQPGTTHTFIDPQFRDTIICDTLEQVRRIATAEVPDEMYAAFYLTTNEYNEPMCQAVVATGVVRGVTPVGVMVRNGKRFDAWAVETEVPGGTIFALYLERIEMLNA
jgi:hypothetical protein